MNDNNEMAHDQGITPVEAYPHIVKKIGMTWGTHELDVYINHLMTDSRDGQRKGFPVGVTDQLLFLQELNKMVRAIDAARKLKVPLRDAYNTVDKQDRGAELGDAREDPLVAQDQYAREEREFTRIAHPPVDRNEGGGFGQWVFSLLTNKAVLFLVALYVAYKVLAPFFHAG